MLHHISQLEREREEERKKPRLRNIELGEKKSTQNNNAKNALYYYKVLLTVVFLRAGKDQDHLSRNETGSSSFRNAFPSSGCTVFEFDYLTLIGRKCYIKFKKETCSEYIC